ncbi:MAG TPA: response regulator [Caldimonas sp.]|jgi:CheY-like chemotaxis protein|nr:response regulator [Caldimonas sp.]HEX2540353.1 response regulator [Caldimonas sp.]
MGAPRRILVADDHENLADLITQLLVWDGYTVAATYDGLQALEVSRSFQPDLAIVDINMPGMDGYSVAAAMRSERPADDSLVLVAMTAYSQPRDIALANLAGFDQHVAKPADPTKLCALVNWLLDR